MGAHSKSRQGRHARIPEQRRGPRPLGITDAQTDVEHLMADPSVEHRHAGRYLALCGTQVLAGSMSQPPGHRCEPCQEARA